MPFSDFSVSFSIQRYPEPLFLFFWILIPMGIYFYLRFKNREMPVTITEYLVMIPLFLMFGWITLFCVWLINQRQQKNR